VMTQTNDDLKDIFFSHDVGRGVVSSIYYVYCDGIGVMHNSNTPYIMYHESTKSTSSKLCLKKVFCSQVEVCEKASINNPTQRDRRTG